MITAVSGTLAASIYMLVDTVSGRYKWRVDLNAECWGLKDGTGSEGGRGVVVVVAAVVANGNHWETWRNQIFLKFYNRALRIHPKWNIAYSHTDTHTHTRANTKAAHAETDGASDFNRSSKSYSPVTMVVAAVDGVIIALPWALL